MAEIKCSFLPDYIFSTALNWSTDPFAIPKNYPVVALHVTYKPDEGEVKNWTDWDCMQFQAITRIDEENAAEVYRPGTEAAKMQAGLECETYLETCNLPSTAAKEFLSKKGKRRMRLTLYAWPKDLAAPAPEWYRNLHGESSDKQATQDESLPPLV